MTKLNKTTLKVLVFSITIMISFVSGAMLQAYAQSNQGESSLPIDATTASDSVTSVVSHTAAEMITVDVYPGDTLWSIAAKHKPQDEDIRSYIHRLKKHNQLKNSNIRAGQILILP